ncbi:protein phosphatase 1 regulatory subunit 26 isoform X2 [Lissotriton helveticus]
MFLMNPPPVVALQTKWGTFGANSYKFPVQFSESEEDIAGTPINAKVQMIITNLQTDESSLDMNNEYECIMQKNRHGDKCVDGFAVNARVVKVQSQECVTVGLPSQIGNTEEENIAFGPLVLDSDSDDSVDRDIEEAIQEYLKTKGESGPSHSSVIECSRTIDSDKYFKSRVSQLSKPQDRMAGRDSESYSEASLEICEKLHHVSPDSDDSDDSFEDSIRAEIEQFLIEKKRMENSKVGSTSGKKTESLPKVKPEKYTGGPEKNCTILKQNAEQFVFGKPKAIKSRPQSRCLNSTSIASSKSLKDNATAVKMSNIRCSMLEQRRVVDAASEPTVEHPMDESSGSSSDDGIEEAIKLFQMEKQKKEGKFTVQHSSSLKNQFHVTNPADSITPISLKGLVVEEPKKTCTKRKRINTKSTDQKLIRACSPNPKALKHNLPSLPPEDKIVQREFSLMGSRRAESAAELLCAEAILDISKTIFPAPVQNYPNSYESTVNSHCILHHSETDSSEVDSDDSIEQEIRSFLAQKAQSECSLKSEDPSRTLTIPQSKPIISCKTSPPGKKLSLSHKRKLKKEKRETAPSEKENIDTTVESSQVTGQGELSRLRHSENDLNNGAKAFQDSLFGKCAQPAVTAGFTAASCHVVASGDMTPPRASFDGGGHERGRFRTRQRNCSGDKSSSLDSDEDLDAAIKDLLRSKRKCKKRTKDQKLHCKKKVRFGETEMQDLETFDALKQKEFSLKCPGALKSCLLKPKEMQQNEVNVSDDHVKEKKETATKTDIASASDILQKVDAPNPVCTTSTSESLMQKCIVESDDSSSVDSDDSIELEIRKFLAEKAKESVSHVQPGDPLAVSNSPEKGKEEVLPRHQMSIEKPKEQSQDSSVASHQLNDSEGKPSESCTSETSTHGVKIQTPRKNTLIPNEVNSPCGKTGAILHKDTNAHQEKLGNNNFRQIVLSADISKSTFPVTFLGNFVAGVQYIPGKVRTVVVNGQHVYSVVPSTRQSHAQALLRKVAFGLDGQTAKTTQSSEVHKGKEPVKQLITIPVISTEPKKLGILKSENLKEQTLGALSLDQASSRKMHAVDPVVSKESHSSMKELPQPLHLSVLKEQQSIKAVACPGQKSAFCTENVNITNKTSEIMGSSSQKVLNESHPVNLKPQSQLECTYLKYTHRVDQREEAVDTGSCRFNTCVENKDSGEKGKGSNL